MDNMLNFNSLINHYIRWKTILYGDIMTADTPSVYFYTYNDIICLFILLLLIYCSITITVRLNKSLSKINSLLYFIIYFFFKYY